MPVHIYALKLHLPGFENLLARPRNLCKRNQEKHSRGGLPPYPSSSPTSDVGNPLSNLWVSGRRYTSAYPVTYPYMVGLMQVSSQISGVKHVWPPGLLSHAGHMAHVREGLGTMHVHVIQSVVLDLGTISARNPFLIKALLRCLRQSIERDPPCCRLIMFSPSSYPWLYMDVSVREGVSHHP